MLTPGRNWSGTELRITITFTDDDGVYVDPDTVTFSLMSPDGTETSYEYPGVSALGKSDTGRYYCDVTPDMGGRWFVRWLTTGTGRVFALEDNFIVQTSPFIDGCQLRDYR